MDAKMEEHKQRFQKALEQLGKDNIHDLSPQSRYELTQALGILMSEASERHVAAGWFGDWARVIHEDFAHDDTKWLDPAIVMALRSVHAILGYWADFDDLIEGVGAVYIPYVYEDDDLLWKIYAGGADFAVAGEDKTVVSIIPDGEISIHSEDES